MKTFFLYTDGGARGNPGPAAAGIVIKDETKKTIKAFGQYLGEQTNNFAEYTALILGLQEAKKLGAETIHCFLDSLLVCEQLNGRWKVKEPNLQKLFVQAWNLTQGFKKIRIAHVRREDNAEADT